MKRGIGIIGSILFAQMSLWAQYGRPTILRDVGIDQKLGAQMPLDVPFTDDEGRTVTLKEYSGKPTIFALVYFTCPSLCDMVLNGVTRAVRELKFSAGDEYQIVAVSFDPRENYLIAHDKKQNYVKAYGRPGAEKGWHFLTGTAASSGMLADAAGFHFRFDPNANQYAHPSSIMILTPQGRIARYFYGIDYPVRDVKLGLVEASNSKIGSPLLDAVQLFCFHYDPTKAKYGLVISNVMRLSGIATVLALATFMIVMFRRDIRAARTKAGGKIAYRTNYRGSRS